MSYRLVEMVLQSALTDPTEVAVLVALASHADEFNSCYPSVARLCQLSRYKERAVQGAIKRLAASGVISVKMGGGRGGASFYTINAAALYPAAGAPLRADKPRSRNPVSDDNTPQQMRETPHLTTENPAADADESVKEPVKNQAAQAREVAKANERLVKLRSDLIASLGLTGEELTTGGTFVVGGMGIHDLPMRLAIWDQHGLTDDQIVLAVAAASGRMREKDPKWAPRSIKYFDAAVADFARDLKAGKGEKPRQKPTYTNPQHAERDAQIRAEYQSLTGKDDAASKARKAELIRQLNDLKRDAA